MLKFLKWFNPQRQTTDILDELLSVSNDNWTDARRGGPNKTVLYVSPTMEMAEERAEQLGWPQKVHFVAMFSSIAGYGYDEIIIDEDAIIAWRNETVRHVALERQKSIPRDIDSYIELLRTRLNTGGSLRYLK